MDIALYYQEKGDKEPLILLHGNGQDGSYFKNQIEYFSDRYRVIALDTRGHGKSPKNLLQSSSFPAICTNLWKVLKFQMQLFWAFQTEQISQWNLQ